MARPYRQVVRVIPIYKGKLVAQKATTHLVLPGGGVDPGESLIQAGKREAMEEIGAVLESMVPFTSVRVKWTPEWATTDTRRARFKKFEGEEEHIYIGRVTKFVKATSVEGDAWQGPKIMTFAKAVSFMSDTMGTQISTGFQLLHMAKMCAIRAAHLGCIGKI